jgi:hypothetical protein
MRFTLCVFAKEVIVASEMLHHATMCRFEPSGRTLPYGDSHQATLGHAHKWPNIM